MEGTGSTENKLITFLLLWSVLTLLQIIYNQRSILEGTGSTANN